MKKVNSEISVHDVLIKCWNNCNPIKFTIDSKVIWDDSIDNLSLLEIEKNILGNIQYSLLYVKEINIKIVDFHHTEVNITTLKKEI